MAVVVLVAVLVAVLTIANWTTVRDHVEAWHFQLTRETKTIEPDPARKRIPVRVEVPGIRSSALARLLQELANYSGYSVICAPEQNMMLDTPILLVARIHKDIAEVEICDADIKAGLKSAGWRVLEQRFPRRAYVVIRAEPLALTLWEAELDQRLEKHFESILGRLPPEPPGALPEATVGPSGTERP